MKSREYLDLLLEGKLVATPSIEQSIAYFTGIPNDLLDIIRELDIKYGVRVSEVTALVGNMVEHLGFIKTIGGIQKAKYENMKDVKDTNIKKFTKYVHDRPIYFNGGESPDEKAIEDIIRKHLPGKYKQQTNLFDESRQKEVTLFHTTLAKNIPAILQKGIVPKKKGLTSGPFGQDIRAAVAVYAFADRLDALQWAHTVEFDTKLKSAVIPFKAVLADWKPDTHWQARLGRGQWLYNPSPVPPEKIIESDIEYPTADTWRWLVKELDKEYQ